jgi:hypothetical protein
LRIPRATPVLAALVAIALGVSAAPALAAPKATLRANLQPNRLGADTTVSIGFRIDPGADGELPPLSGFSLRLPSGMGFAASTLGLATCSASTLLSRGANGCPHESLMGFGSARVQVPFDTGAVSETASVSIFMTKPVSQRTTTLFYFDGRRPVIAPLVLQSQVLTPRGSHDSVLATPIAPIPTVPDGPEVAMVALRASIGPPTLRYFKRVDHRRVAYKPEGLSIPGRCPRGGFGFGASFLFRDGSRTGAQAVVPCPPSRPVRRAAGGKRQ